MYIVVRMSHASVAGQLVGLCCIESFMYMTGTRAIYERTALHDGVIHDGQVHHHGAVPDDAALEPLWFVVRIGFSRVNSEG